MTAAEFDALLTKLINAGYDCGEWKSPEGNGPFYEYDELLKKLSAAKQAVLDAYMNKESE